MTQPGEATSPSSFKVGAPARRSDDTVEGNWGADARIPLALEYCPHAEPRQSGGIDLTPADPLRAPRATLCQGGDYPHYVEIA